MNCMRSTPLWTPAAALLAAWGAVTGGQVHAQEEAVSVLNGGFEVFEQLPSASGQLHLAPGWTDGGSAEARADYYHENGSNGGDLPQTPLAKVDAFEGRAVAGFVAWTDEEDPHFEYLTGQFSRPLEVGQRYEMSFAISSGRVHDWVQAGIGVSDLGISLGHAVPTQVGHEPLEGHVQFSIHQALYNRNWKRFRFVFTASEPFTHFTFGVFAEDVRRRQVVDGDRTMAYYFVDDFSIREVSASLGADEAADRGTPGTPLPDGVFMPNAFSPDGDNVNDTWSPVMPEGVTGECVVVNRWGEVVWSSLAGVDATWDGFDLNGVRCPAGMYVWKLSTSEPVEGVSEWKGWVNVLR